jgi:uncharacterized repeat protein (TIGR01451 family)
MASGAGTVISLVATPTAVGPVTNILTATTASSDTNPTNNLSTNIVTVAPRMPVIVAAGAVLTYESGPVNGAIDPGETVTLSLSLRNVGATNTPSNFMATLLTGGGVSQIQGPATQTYGTVVAGGAAVAKPFTFTATGAIGGTVTATLQLTNGVNTNITFVFNFPAISNFANASQIIIPDHGPGGPYPLTISVSGMTGEVSKVTVTLNGFTHSFPRDVSALLVSPSGANVLVISHAGSGHSVTNLTLTFDDGASNTLPQSSTITSGSYRPTAYNGPSGPAVLPPPAPLMPYGSVLGKINGTQPNGTWSLYVLDDSPGDSGLISSGWSLSISTISPVSPIADVGVTLVSAPASIYLGDTLTNTLLVTNLGPNPASAVTLTNPLPSGWSYLTGSSSQGSVALVGANVVGALGAVASQGAATVTIVTLPTVAGALTNVFTVGANETDLNLANNQVLAPINVINSAPLLHGSIAGGNFQLTATAPSNLVYEVLVSTNLTSWLSVSTNTTINGVFTFTDTNSPNFQHRFYRTVRVVP